MCTPLPLQTMVLDQDVAVEFLGTVAHAMAAERHIKMVWKDYDQSTVINIIYAILPMGKPGIAEVDPGDINQVLAEASEKHEELLQGFARALSMGPAKTTDFLRSMEQIRESCLETVQSVYRDAADLNSDMQHEARRAVARLTLIKASSTLVLKTAALFGGGLPAFLIGTGYDVTLDYIKNMDKAPDAKLIGVASKTGDKLGKKVVKDAAKNMANIYKGEGSAPASKAEWLEKRLAQMEQELQDQATAQQLQKFAKDSRKLARAQQAAASARRGALVMSGVKYVFFAWDVYKTVQDARSNFSDAGYGSTADALRDAL